MYVRRIMIEQAVKAFTENPELRDDRYGFIEYMMQQNFYYVIGSKDVILSYRIMHDIDRCFRMIQQRVPELRGKKWEQRQKKGGHGATDEYASMQKELDDAVKQSAFNFTGKLNTITSEKNNHE